MSIFRKKKAGEAAAEIPAVQETPRRTVQRASLTSGRMAALFQRLYRWVFSVNVTAGVYQIESGEDTFAREPLPIRGYYSALLAHLADELPEGERETFARMFSAESIGRAMESGSTSLRGIFSAYELGVEDSEGRERPLCWYEFRAEWVMQVDLQNRVCVLSVRQVQGDLDRGQDRKPAAAPRTEEGEIDWEALRVRDLDRAADGMDFEYNVAEDVVYLHRLRGSSEGDRVTKNFLSRLPTATDRVLSHESTREVQRLFRSDCGRIDVPADCRTCGRYTVDNSWGHYHYGWYIEQDPLHPTVVDSKRLPHQGGLGKY